MKKMQWLVLGLAMSAAYGAKGIIVMAIVYVIVWGLKAAMTGLKDGMAEACRKARGEADSLYEERSEGRI